MAEVRFKDLPPEAQAMLRDLTVADAKMLAIGAAHAREAERFAGYPTDPTEAMRDARKVANAPVRIETDDPVGLAIDTLEVATAALSRGSFDDHDASALVTLLMVAESALRDHRRNQDEASDRIRAVLFPQK